MKFEKITLFCKKKNHVLKIGVLLRPSAGIVSPAVMHILYGSKNEAKEWSISLTPCKSDPTPTLLAEICMTIRFLIGIFDI